MALLLQNKVALVTGASRGIGQATAETLAANGCQVVLTARSADVNMVAEQINAAGHGQAISLMGNLTDAKFVRELVQFSRTEFKQLDILVNNAGVLLPGVVGMIRLEDIETMMQINTVALINLTQYAIRLFPREMGGSVVNITSLAAIKGLPGLAAYAAAKAAQIGFTRTAAQELAARNIRVNAVAPGFIDTALTANLPESYRVKASEIPLGRQGTVQDVANCVLYLASGQASYITGQVIGVDGGLGNA